MSRIGKKSIIIPAPVSMSLEGRELKAKGPKGEGSLIVTDGFDVELNDNMLKVVPLRDSKETSVKWGTLRSKINNLIEGAEKGFVKQLEINGVGYQANVEGKNLNLKLGYSHPVIVPIEEGLEVKVEKNIITVSGISKERVNQFAALIKSKRPVEPYRGKGIYYVGEDILRKVGKKVSGSAA
ncbi:MAG: 50S ribosomal protein L6 [Candidatus Pacebacteria bacterium]|nr:50S ribosomal protein L6 [Candidatus Paceibacterota bacterium]